MVMRIIDRLNQILKDSSTDEDADPKREKHSTALVFVMLEICVRDLIKYLPNLIAESNNIEQQSIKKNSFFYMHINSCKKLGPKDVELLKSIILVLNKIPFQSNLQLDSKFNLNKFR